MPSEPEWPADITPGDVLALIRRGINDPGSVLPRETFDNRESVGAWGARAVLHLLTTAGLLPRGDELAYRDHWHELQVKRVYAARLERELTELNAAYRKLPEMLSAEHDAALDAADATLDAAHASLHAADRDRGYLRAEMRRLAAQWEEHAPHADESAAWVYDNHAAELRAVLEGPLTEEA